MIVTKSALKKFVGGTDTVTIFQLAWELHSISVIQCSAWPFTLNEHLLPETSAFRKLNVFFASFFAAILQLGTFRGIRQFCAVGHNSVVAEI